MSLRLLGLEGHDEGQFRDREFRTMKNLTQAWRILNVRERRTTWAMVIVLLIGTGLEVVSIGMVMPVVASLTSDQGGTSDSWIDPLLNAGNRFGSTPALLALLVALFAIKATYATWSTWHQRGFAARLERRLASDLFRGYLGRPYSFHLENNSAVGLRKVKMSSDFVRLTVDSLLVLATDGVLLLALVVFLVGVEPIGTILVLVTTGGAGCLLFLATRGRIGEWSERLIRHESNTIQFVQEGLGSIAEIKVLGREEEFVARLDHELGESTSILRGYGVLTSIPRIWLEFLTILGVFVLVGAMLARGSQLTDLLPVLGLFAATSFKVMPTINRLIFAVQNLRFSSPIIQQLHEEIGQDTKRTKPSRLSAALGDVAIEFRAASFAYQGRDERTLRDINLVIKKGEAVGFVGSSGSGKSTLVNLLLGLLVPTSGEVLVDIELSTERALGGGARHGLGYVPQTIHLLDETIRENIAFGIPKEEIDVDRINEVVRLACLTDFIHALPDGLDTVIGEHGARMSGGQRQRIGIARALYVSPAVLVLDEATSSLDEETEAQIVEELTNLRGRVSIVVVAHRPAAVSICDRVFAVRDGVIHSVGVWTPAEYAKNFTALNDRG